MSGVWKKVDGFENYEVSPDGIVRNTKRDIVKASKDDRKGYRQVSLYRNGKEHHRKVHRLVAEAYIPNPDNKPCINHKDGNKLNNSVDNLEWVTYSENTIHAYRSGLNKPHPSYGMRGKKNPNGGAKGKPIVINETGEVFKNIVDCARRKDLRGKSITDTLHGRQHTHRGYSFSFYSEESEEE